jgi:hypothetical protein
LEFFQIHEPFCPRLTLVLIGERKDERGRRHRPLPLISEVSREKVTGREFDSETGLQYNRALAAGDSNLYRYVNNSPMCRENSVATRVGFSWNLWSLPNRGRRLATVLQIPEQIGGGVR